jgi:hypothetical protein
MSTAISAIENNCIAANTKQRYNCTNHDFVMWLYLHRATFTGLLQPELVQQLDSVMNDNNIEEKKKKKITRRIVVNDWLQKMVRRNASNDDTRQLCPVIMEKVTYEVAATYMTQKKDKDDRFLGKGTYCGIRSAIINLFTMSNVPPPPQFRDKVAVLLKGFRRTITEQKVAAGDTLEEGKEVMSFACYKLLCEKFSRGEKDEYNFAHLFLTLEWNLMAWADSIVHLSMNDFEWSDDSLIVFLRKTKTDQEGANSKIPYHLYANPIEPCLSVVLALGVYLLTNPGLLVNSAGRAGGKIFPAEFQYSRYSKILSRVISENKEEFERIGVKEGTIGSHSARKGAATLAASGCTVSPSMASICNRAQWKMGGTRDKYIKFENAGDQFLGRCLTGLNSLQKEFSISPPFFNVDDEETASIDRLLRLHVVGGGQITASLFEVLRMCFASVVFHKGWLLEHAHEKNRIRSHPLLVNMPEVSIFVCFFFKFEKNSPFFFFHQTLDSNMCKPLLYDDANACSRCPRLTGIPPHVALLNEMAALRKVLTGSTSEIVVAMKTELNLRGIGGETFQANQVLDDVKRVHEQMHELMRMGGNIEGPVGAGNNTVALRTPDSEVPMLIEQDSMDGDDGTRTRREMYCWGGKLHNVPENFVIPRMTLQTLVCYWYCGSTNPHCPPLRYAKAFDFPTKKSMRTTLSQMKRMVKEVVRAGRINNFYFGNGIKTTAKATQLYEAVYPMFAFPGINHTRRFCSISWKTYYNQLLKNRGKLIGE